MISKRCALSLEEVSQQIRDIQGRIREEGANGEEIHLLNHYRHVYSQLREAAEHYTLRQIRRSQDGMTI